MVPCLIILQVEQLCEQAGEESIIITASLSDGSLSHLGSKMGNGFFEEREEIKSQFLGYCLKSKYMYITNAKSRYTHDVADMGP